MGFRMNCWDDTHAWEKDTDIQQVKLPMKIMLEDDLWQVVFLGGQGGLSDKVAVLTMVHQVTKSSLLVSRRFSVEFLGKKSDSCGDERLEKFLTIRLVASVFYPLRIHRQLGSGFKCACFIFHHYERGRCVQFDYTIFFSDGWFNHQLGNLKKKLVNI